MDIDRIGSDIQIINDLMVKNWVSSRRIQELEEEIKVLKSFIRTVNGCANDPLTLEQLQKMDGQPVWVQTPGIEKYGRWAIVAGVNIEDKVLYCQGDYTCRDYGRVWIAYGYPTAHIDWEAWSAEWEEDGECNHKPYRVRDAEKWKKYKCSKCGYKAGRRTSQKYCPWL